MRFEEFLNERKYLLNVSHKTLVYYKCAFKAWEKHSGDGKPATWIKNMLESGIKPVSVNTYICAMNAYWKWSGERQKLKYIKEEQKILATLDERAIQSVVSFKPTGTNLRRAHVVALVALDTGLRISEILGLAEGDCQMDDLVFRVLGKGGKHRLVPFSSELRKSLFKLLCRKQEGNKSPRYIFGTKNDTKVTVRNFERDLKILGQKVGITGIRFSPHTLRHTFAVSYLKNGGNLEYLRRILGHTSLSTTQKYLRSLGVEAIQEVHHLYSPLSVRHGNGRLSERG